MMSWSLYQMAVTKYKESETQSSSIYNQNSPTNPQVSFISLIRQTYIFSYTSDGCRENPDRVGASLNSAFCMCSWHILLHNANMAKSFGHTKMRALLVEVSDCV